MTLSVWTVALSGEPQAIARALSSRASAAAGPPDDLQLEYKAAKVGGDWMARLLAATQARATWKTNWSVSMRKGVIVEATVVGIPATAHGARELLADVPFEVASFATLHPSWYGGDDPYHAPRFADGHMPHGWACAFRGAGHERLVSRRWLEHGPWALQRGADDVSLVLFHDPAADADTALAQAKPGHARMGIAHDGGYIQSNFVFEHDLKGRYLPARKEMRIIASRRDVEPSEMLEACAARKNRQWGLDTPVERVAYAFLEEERARRHLHELWLRELGCLAMIEGDEQRLDLAYAPVPAPPAWAAALTE